jgi:hypothetical protein
MQEVSEFRLSLEPNTSEFKLKQIILALCTCINLQFQRINKNSSEELFARLDSTSESLVSLTSLSKDLSLVLLNSMAPSNETDLIEAIFKQDVLYVDKITAGEILRLLKQPEEDDNLEHFAWVVKKCWKIKAKIRKQVDDMEATLAENLRLKMIYQQLDNRHRQLANELQLKECEKNTQELIIKSLKLQISRLISHFLRI